MSNVADPHHFDAVPDQPFRFDLDPDPTFHFDADPDPPYPDPAPHQGDANPRPLTYLPSKAPLWASTDPMAPF
jgi:hypothetical protein